MGKLWEFLNQPAFGSKPPAQTLEPLPRERAPILGASTDSSHIGKARETILDKDECLLGAFHGQPLRDGKAVAALVAHHYLLITDKRVIFWGRGLTSSSVDAFAYRDISSVDAHQGMLLGDVVLNVKGAKEKFQSIPKNDVHTAAKLIRNMIEQSNAAVAGAKPESVTEQIKKLAELRDSGILTEEEFQNKKTELLARI